MIKRGGIYLVNLNPIKGREQAGRRPVLEDLCLVFFSKDIKAALILRPGAYDTHLPFQHIDKLRQFIDLRPPQDPSKRQNAGIVFKCNRASADGGTFFQHGGKRDLFEFFRISGLT